VHRFARRRCRACAHFARVRACGHTVRRLEALLDRRFLPCHVIISSGRCGSRSGDGSRLNSNTNFSTSSHSATSVCDLTRHTFARNSLPCAMFALHYTS
jgi:hypothetical protein